MNMEKKNLRTIICFLGAVIMSLLVCEEVAAKKVKVADNNALSKYLDKQIETGKPDQLREVVGCKQVTEDHLVKVAQICVNHDDMHWAWKLARKLDKTPKCTGKVMQELSKSKEFQFRLIVAKSKKSYKKTLEALAKDLVTEYANSGMTDPLWDMTEALMNNKKSSSKVFCSLAICCVSHGNADYAIEFAKKLIKKPACNDSVMQELAKSDCFRMHFIVAKSKKSHEKSLTMSAEYCANLSYTRALQLAKLLDKNPNRTIKVMEKLSESRFSEVVSIGHKAIEEIEKKAKKKKAKKKKKVS